METMIYLDTNIILRLASNTLTDISQQACDVLENTDELFISPMVELELEYLYEIKRINKKPDFILNYLKKSLGLTHCEKSFIEVIKIARTLNWTRDPFDRLITAQAATDQATLITTDQKILKHYKAAIG
jgi:PIN domain nuclease of toxin-antitoxin system